MKLLIENSQADIGLLVRAVEDDGRLGLVVGGLLFLGWWRIHRCFRVLKYLGDDRFLSSG